MAKDKEKNFCRSCPECKKEIWYKTEITLKRASIKKALCNFCSRKGEKNYFFGKTHKPETIEKFKNKDCSYMKDASYKEAYYNSLINRKTNKKPIYQCWLEKYGQEEADIKMGQYRAKQSFNNSGSKNSMFGKPSPNGSGNGWSGWYKGWRFRSLLEVAFMINYIEKNNLKWESGEKKKFMIKYFDADGTPRNYYPDFYLPDKRQLIECKPIKLFNTVTVKQKKEAAEKFCSENELEYNLTDIERLTDETIKSLYLSGELKFIERYDKKWRDRFLP
jgi:hypothetical protein